MTDTPALLDPRLHQIDHEVVRHGPVSSLAEAARARGVSESQVVKTMVVRMDADSYLFVLVPGDRNISWPLLREHLGVNRVSMPDAEEARSVTGYARGTITPFGATTDWPVIVDSSLAGIVSLGGGAAGVSITATIEDIGRVLEAVSAGVTEAV